MKNSFFTFVFAIATFLKGNAQTEVAFINAVIMPEYKIMFVQPTICTAEKTTTQNKFDSLAFLFGTQIFNELGAADKTALGFEKVATPESFCNKYVTQFFYSAAAIAQKSKMDSVNYYRKKGFLIFSLSDTARSEHLKLGKLKLPQKINTGYEKDIIAEKKKSGKKNFSPALSFLLVDVTDNKTIAERKEYLLTKGFKEITQQINGAPKNHLYFLRQEIATGMEEMYELVHLNNGKIYQLSYYLGLSNKDKTLPETQQMNYLKSTFQKVLSTIDKEVGTHTNFMTSTATPYTENDLLIPALFFKGIDENKIGYWANWISIDKKGEPTPTINLELYRNKKIKLTLTDTDYLRKE